MKFVLNKCYGGFSLSKKAQEMLGVDSPFASAFDRNDPKLIEVVEKLGKEANGNYTELVVVEIPSEATDYEIDNYDGIENIIYVLDGKIYHV